jgi:uncharacterized protein YndB with AHSA1/START domain
MTELILTRRFDAAPERVFDAWTDPELLRRWFHAGPDWTTPEADVDLRPGGRYRLAMRNPDGEVRAVAGEYREIERPGRLVYTWAWEAPEGSEMAGETLVTVEFSTTGDGTDVVLTQTGFPSAHNRDQHGHGWDACLANLEALFA